MYKNQNLLQKSAKFLRLIQKKYSFPPKDITIEISTKCNQTCKMCFRTPLQINEDIMRYENYEKIFLKLKNGFSGKIKYLTFVGLGEVFENPDFNKILYKTKKELPETKINVSTNLTIMDDSSITELIKNKLIDHISFSLDHLDLNESTYHIYNNELISNIKNLVSIRSRYYPSLPIRMQSIILAKSQIKNLIDFASDHKIDSIQLIRMDLHLFDKSCPVKRISYFEERKLINYANKYARLKNISIFNNNSQNIFMRLASFFDKQCLLTDDHLFIDVKGNVLPCFLQRRYVFGNLLKHSVKDIFREKTKDNFYYSQSTKCKGCDEYKEKYHH